ncbi:MAG: nucleotide exchange factor GrpE [Anaerolineales bacterium]
MTKEEQAPESSEKQQATSLDELQEKLAAAQAEIEELKDKHLRTAAEFANYRKRQERDARQQEQRLKAAAYRSVLPVLDDLQLAVKHAPQGAPNGDWVEGVLLIERKFQKILDDANIKPIETVGKPFDPNLHSALLQVPSNEHPAGHIVQEVKAGYLMGDQVLRPATVVVSSGPEEHSDAPKDQG